MSLDVRVAHIQLIRRVGDQDERVMSQSGPLELGVAPTAKPRRLQAGPPEPLTRGGRSDRDERVIFKGSEQRPRCRRFPLHVDRCTLPLNDRTYVTTQPPVRPHVTVATGPRIIRAEGEKRR